MTDTKRIALELAARLIGSDVQNARELIQAAKEIYKWLVEY